MTESSWFLLESTLWLSLHSSYRVHSNGFPLNRPGHDKLHWPLPEQFNSKGDCTLITSTQPLSLCLPIKMGIIKITFHTVSGNQWDQGYKSASINHREIQKGTPCCFYQSVGTQLTKPSGPSPESMFTPTVLARTGPNLHGLLNVWFYIPKAFILPQFQLFPGHKRESRSRKLTLHKIGSGDQ